MLFFTRYDPSKPTKTLLYMDANSLYPTAMCLPLPVDQFEWMERVDDFNVAEHADDAEHGLRARN